MLVECVLQDCKQWELRSYRINDKWRDDAPFIINLKF
ncbi:hypothetical protein Pecwa_1635 [Pectobacterium parmentieri WPP163]|nr:hypothetical protein Pecwa_1635 [Pectobacterium parmentieri WPP163]